MSNERAPINVILRGERSGGQIAVMDNVVGAGFAGPTLHHHGFDETFYVLEGELTFQLEDEIFTRKQGELAFAPRNVAHTFANLSGAEARVLIVCTPAGFERYFARMAAEGQGKFRPEARHSRNVAARPELALVVFDSTVAPGDAADVYGEGRGP
jgi:quercetin dioxygenase-like cupin family protein